MSDREPSVDFGDELDSASLQRPWKMYAAIGFGIIALFGVLTWALGLGPFGYRQFAYGTAEIFMLNMTDQKVQVSIDGGKTVDLVPNGFHRMPLLGGTSQITTRDMQGKVLEDLTLTTKGLPVLYNVQGHKCMVLADVSSFYEPTQENGSKVIKTYARNKHNFIHVPSKAVVWPRETIRDEIRGVDGGVYWVETVACPMIEPDEEHVLASQLDLRLTERKQRERDRKLRRKMLFEGSEAVDQAQAEKERKKRERMGGATLKTPQEMDAGVDGGP